MNKTSRRKMTRLRTCAVIGGAVAAVPLASDAAIITVPVNVTINYPDSYDLTISPTLGGAAINENGGPDLTFTASSFAIFGDNTVAGDNGSEFVVDSTGNPANLSGGTVGPNNNYSAGPGDLSTPFSGNFDKNGASGYLGFEVPVTGAPNGFDYGYVKLSAPAPFEEAPSITLDYYAYDDSGAPIQTPSPEPTTLALLAAGAIGLEAVRRRAKALKK
jgi:PEP-CTERM motif